MPFEPGARLGPYEILSTLGSGGMGVVYRARDTRLGRDVAVKVLPEHLSAQPEIRARFEREAKTVSSLNHPHICTLFDIGREGETDYLVLELIEGETLADRLKRGPLPPAELLRFGTQVADALDRAHRAGVIHRDLKPGNIMITRSGAKLMDFGLSRAVGMASAASGSNPSLSALTASPTIAQALTSQGTLLGTFQYMSPEQLEGREADARSDIWALGCVLYEMATGRRAFDARSQASLIAAILEREPAPIGEVPSGTTSVSGAGGAPGLERLIRLCLAKDPEDRIQTAHDVRLRLQEIAESSGLSTTSVAMSAVTPASGTYIGAARPAAKPSPLPWALAALGFLAAIASVAFLYPKTKHERPPVLRYLTGAIMGTSDSFWPRVSPDGRYLCLEAVDSLGVVRAYIRPLDQLEAHPIPGTEDLRRAYWSPDSREVAFLANGKIQRVSIAGGSPVLITAAPGGADISWGSKGQILMDGSFTDSLRVVPAGGGELRPASRIDRAAHEVGAAWPSFLPDGEHFLFIGNLGTSNFSGNIRLGKLGSLESKILGHSDGRVEYAPGGWVLFVRETSLMAQKLDLAAGKLTGSPITITDRLRVGNASGHYSISQSGILAYTQAGAQEGRTLMRADRRGAMVGAPLVIGTLSNPTLGPDRRRLLYQRTPANGTGSEISVYDLARNTDTPLTFTGGIARCPQWSPDGSRIAYLTRRIDGVTTLRTLSADGLGAVDSLRIAPGHGTMLTQWSSSGPRFLLWDFGGNVSAWATPPGAGLRPTVALFDSTEVFAEPQISPDGRWAAGIVGTTSTNIQVFVVSLTGTAGRWQISTSPSEHPVWTKGGSELIYEGLDGRLMAVDIETQGGFHPGTPKALFTLPTPSFGADERSWSCDPEGENFFLVVPPRSAGAGKIEVISDFNSLVTRK